MIHTILTRVITGADRLTRGAAIAWGIWTPRVALTCGLLWALGGFHWTLLALGFTLSALVARYVDRPRQRALRAGGGRG